MKIRLGISLVVAIIAVVGLLYLPICLDSKVIFD